MILRRLRLRNWRDICGNDIKPEAGNVKLMKTKILEEIAIHRRMLDKFQAEDIDVVAKMANMIIDCLRSGGTIYLCGNGGSASDCQHIAGEFVGRFKKERKPLAAVSLCADIAVMTCLGNDYGYEHVFSRPVEALMKSGDLLWAFSTSGTSKNVLAAAEKAIQKKAGVIAFTGKPGSQLEKISHACLVAHGPYSAHSQQIHQLAYHIICDLVETEMAK